MKFSTICILGVGLSEITIAYPSLALETLEERANTHPFKGVPAGGVRSPCPGSNTLANHGFINRNGKNITAKAYQSGFLNAFGMSFEATETPIKQAFFLCATLTGAACASLDLDMLSTPHAQEHDASITRNDKEMIDNPDANNAVFNETVWQRSMSIAGNVTHINAQIANTIRLRRVEQAQQDDVPGWFRELVGNSLGEATFYLTTMNDPALGQDPLVNPQARLDWINYWFVNERLPTALGWVRPTKVISNIQTLTSIIEAQSTIPASTTSSTGVTSSPTSSPTGNPGSATTLFMSSSAATPTATVTA